MKSSKNLKNLFFGPKSSEKDILDIHLNKSKIYKKVKLPLLHSSLPVPAGNIIIFFQKMEDQNSF